MITGFHHVGLVTDQLDRMIEFYRDALGFEVTSRSGWERGRTEVDELLELRGSAAEFAMLRNGSMVVEIFEFSAPAGDPGDPGRPVCDHGYTHFCLGVRDIDAEYERLLAAGMRFNSPPFPAAGEAGPGDARVAYGRDPEGNVIELLEEPGAPAP